MTLYFAYGSNMSRSLMARRSPGAVAIGPAQLEGWRFLIMGAGYASIMPRIGAVVHGVIWRLTPRDAAALNAYESLDSGLYGRRIVAVRHGSSLAAALTYVARDRSRGRPRPGYQALVVEAARDWKLPVDYVRSLERYAASRLGGSRIPETGEL